MITSLPCAVILSTRVRFLLRRFWSRAAQLMIERGTDGGLDFPGLLEKAAFPVTDDAAAMAFRITRLDGPVLPTIEPLGKDFVTGH